METSASASGSAGASRTRYQFESPRATGISEIHGRHRGGEKGATSSGATAAVRSSSEEKQLPREVDELVK